MLQAGLAQDSVLVDSLQRIIHAEPSEKEVVGAYNQLIWQFMYSNPDSALVISRQGDAWSKKNSSTYGRAVCLTNIGIAHYVKGNYDEAIAHYKEAYEHRLAMDDEKGAAGLLHNIGAVYDGRGRYVEALKYYLEALEIKERLGDPKDVGATLNNIGLVFYNDGDLDKALEFFTRYFETYDTLENAGDALAVGYNNLGMVNTELQNFDLALEQLRTANQMFTELGSIARLVKSNIQLGITWNALGKADSALARFHAALSNAEKVNDDYGLAGAHFRASEIYLDRGDLENAIRHAEQGLEKSKIINSLEMLKKNHQVLWQAYKKKNDIVRAFEHLESYMAYKDSMFNKENTREITQREMEYDFAKEQLRDSLKTAEEKRLAALRHEQEIKQQRIYTYAGVAVGFLMLAIAIVLFRNYRQKRRSNILLEQKNKDIAREKQKVEMQKEVVEEKNKEILDSINYAKRLQEAILPSMGLVKEHLPQSFILYKPKDIVAGDFYWMESFAGASNSEERRHGHPEGLEGRSSAKASDAKGWSYIAAADCTGHGVPGAMVSVVCSNALSKALIEEGITDTGKLLDRTRELVIERFGKTDAEIKDGMDISLAAIRHDGKQVRWSGANNPLWVVKGKDSDSDWDSDSTLMEIKADKQPIGKYTHSKPFTQHTIDLHEGDTLYMFSDGYPDQFGGEKGKKYKSGKLKKFLLSIQDKSMAEQKQLLDQEFENWRGDLEQIDDVCVIGVKL